MLILLTYPYDLQPPLTDRRFSTATQIMAPEADRGKAYSLKEINNRVSPHCAGEYLFNQNKSPGKVFNFLSFSQNQPL